MMKRVRTTSSGSPVQAWHSPPWTCQLIHVDVTEECLVFDFVALESPPTSPIVIPPGTPLSMHVRRGRAGIDADLVQHVVTWAENADVVAIFGGHQDGTTWLCLSSGDTHLVVELA